MEDDTVKREIKQEYDEKLEIRECKIKTEDIDETTLRSEFQIKIEPNDVEIKSEESVDNPDTETKDCFDEMSNENAGEIDIKTETYEEHPVKLENLDEETIEDCQDMKKEHVKTGLEGLRKSTHFCCVPSCKKAVFPNYRFPNPKLYADRFLKWKNAVRNPRHTGLRDEEIFKRSFVCVHHFSANDIKPKSHKLRKTAIPHLNLPEDFGIPKIVPEESRGSREVKDVAKTRKIREHKPRVKAASASDVEGMTVQTTSRQNLEGNQHRI